ncbi:MAG TPA: zf-HC2 domain-containing protein [Gemmatimonadaceae bacterium]|nr:zf-HC2 domain-containing protein [Gemmatimonadaceae bacterium]
MNDERLMTCEQLDERLSDWLENDVDLATRAMLERHVGSCARCTALMADLALIRREASSLPELVPSRDLWPEIEARIQAPVIPLEQSRVATAASHRGGVRRAWWLGAAAAGLVAVTAGVTHYMTKQTQPQSVVAVSPESLRTPDAADPAVVTEPSAPLTSGLEEQAPPRERQLVSAPAAAEQSEYARDVAQLRAIVSQRRAEFDSTTIAVLEKNLELIDRAIAESRAALRADPASDFLADQLARAMTKKVAILRTVALLPSRS